VASIKNKRNKNTKMKTVRNFIILIAVTLLMVSCSTEKSSQPNIIFIYADDWGFGDLSCNGSTFCQTPNLDKMAEEGTSFKNFTVVNPVCSPSRTSVMTGNFPARHSVHGHFATVQSHMNRNMPDWLSPKVTLLPKLLKKAGYTTAHYGKWHLSNTHVSDAPSPLEYGYDDFGCFNISNNFRQMSADSTIYKTIEFIEKNKKKPFFVNAWIHATHTPHYPKEKYLKQFQNLNEREQVYASIIADADYKIGLLFDKLKELGLDENTLVIFSSDNGPEITGKKQWGHDNSTGPGLNSYFSVGETAGLNGQKHSIFAGGVRVPFLVKWPGVVPAGRIDTTTALASVDLLPTFSELAGISLPENYKPDGQSIVKAIKGEPFKRDKTIYWQWKSARNRPYFWANAGIQEDNWRLLVNEELEKQELYDINSDWGEQENVIVSHPEKAQKLLLKLQQWEKTLPTEPSPDCFSAERKILKN
jgi:arylsulfatase A-like enzyme